MVTLALLLALFLVQDKPAEKCALSGTVTDSVTGLPLNKTQILAELELLGSPDAPAFTVNTDAKGNFSMAGIEPGKYRVRGVRNGYLDTYYGARRSGSKGTTITLDTGQSLTDLQLKLLPYAVIAGTVRDADGEAIAGAKVLVRRLTFRNGYRELDGYGEIVTDDLGQYRAANLVPGKYYVQAQPREVTYQQPLDRSASNSPPREVLVPTFYPGVLDPAGAGAVDVLAGARITGIDVPLIRSRVYRVSGHIALPPGTTGYAALGHPDSLWGRYLYHTDDARRVDFEIRNVPPGSYTLSAGGFEPSGTGPAYNAELPLEINGDIADLKINPEASPKFSGHVTIESDKPVKLDHAMLTFGPSYAAPILDDLSTPPFPLEPGHYPIGVIGPALQQALVIKSIRVGQADILRDGLTLIPGGDVQVEIVLAPDGGQIEGMALDKDENPIAGATVVAVPDRVLRGRPDRFYQASTDQYGRYELKNVAPGDYKIFAWDDIEPGVWFDPDFFRDLESRGEAVKLGAKGHETAKVHTLGAK